MERLIIELDHQFEAVHRKRVSNERQQHQYFFFSYVTQQQRAWWQESISVRLEKCYCRCLWVALGLPARLSNLKCWHLLLPALGFCKIPCVWGRTGELKPLFSSKHSFPSNSRHMATWTPYWSLLFWTSFLHLLSRLKLICFKLDAV